MLDAAQPLRHHGDGGPGGTGGDGGNGGLGSTATGPGGTGGAGGPGQAEGYPVTRRRAAKAVLAVLAVSRSPLGAAAPAAFFKDLPPPRATRQVGRNMNDTLKNLRRLVKPER